MLTTPVPEVSVSLPEPATSVSLPVLAVMTSFRLLPVRVMAPVLVPVRFCTLAASVT